MGFRTESLAELEGLAAQEGAVVEELDWPGGGRVVRLKDPDGHGVEVVAGQTKVNPLSIREEPVRNSASIQSRSRTAVRLDKG